MKLAKNIRPELVASKDKYRLALSEPYLKVSNGSGRLIATNGKSLVVIPVEVEADDASGYISPEVLKRARAIGSKHEAANVICNGVAKFADGSTLPRTKAAAGSRYPNYRPVVAGTLNQAGAVTVKIDATLLADLAKALGTETVSLSFNPETIGTPGGAAIEVRPLGQKSHAFGLLMPIRREQA